MAPCTVYPRQRSRPRYTPAWPASRSAAGRPLQARAPRAGGGRTPVVNMATNPGRRLRLVAGGRQARAWGLAVADLFPATPLAEG